MSPSPPAGRRFAPDPLTASLATAGQDRPLVIGGVAQEAVTLLASLLPRVLDRPVAVVLPTHAHTELAVGAAGLARLAHGAPVQDQRVRQAGPAGAREEPHQIGLDLDWILLAGEPESIGKALDVSVHHHAFVQAERGSQHHVRGLVL